MLFTGSSETPDDAAMSSVVISEPSELTYLNSFCIGFRFHDDMPIEPSFAKHLFRAESIRRQLRQTANGVTRFNVSKPALGRVIIPVPPLEEQQRIVDILDRFDALVNDLTIGLPAELAARRQQYVHYRDRLLSFTPLAG